MKQLNFKTQILLLITSLMSASTLCIALFSYYTFTTNIKENIQEKLESDLNLGRALIEAQIREIGGLKMEFSTKVTLF